MRSVCSVYFLPPPPSPLLIPAPLPFGVWDLRTNVPPVSRYPEPSQANKCLQVSFGIEMYTLLLHHSKTNVGDSQHAEGSTARARNRSLDDGSPRSWSSQTDSLPASPAASRADESHLLARGHMVCLARMPKNMLKAGDRVCATVRTMLVMDMDTASVSMPRVATATFRSPSHQRLQLLRLYDCTD